MEALSRVNLPFQTGGWMERQVKKQEAIFKILFGEDDDDCDEIYYYGELLMSG